MARVLDVDPVTGVTEVFHYDPTNDTSYVEMLQDVSALAETNKALYAMTDERAGWKGDFHRVASLPAVIVQELNNKGIFRGFHCLDMKAFKRWMNDSDNRVFRTRGGRV